MEMKVPVAFEPDETIATIAVKVLEAFMNSHADYDLRATEQEDGTIRYSVVRKDAPCIP